MIKNSDKKGLSTVVTTLIIILLVFVAIGIVWVVVRNVVEQGAGQIDIGAKCIGSSVAATSVTGNCTTSDPCDVVLKRDTGDDEIGGVKLVFYEGQTGGSAIDVSGNIATLSTTPVTNIDSGLTNPDKVEVTVYFFDDSNNERLCTTSSSFIF